MKKLLFLLLAIILSISCEDAPTLSSRLQTFNESELAICHNTECPKITLDYPLYSGEGTPSEAINEHIKDYIITSLHLSEDRPTPNALEEVATAFVKANNDLKTDFDMALNYEATVTVEEIFRNENLLTLEKRNYLFTGGAHGYGSVHFSHFDLKTGEELDTPALFDDYEGFVNMAEKTFRKLKGIPEGDSINANGFWFNEDQFHLPDSIGLAQEGILLIYNQYDIASYADGPIEVIIAWDDATPYLSKIYFP